MTFSIKKRIYWSFLVLVILFVVNGIATIITLHFNGRRSDKITNVVDQCFQQIDDLQKILVQTQTYSTNWAFLRSNMIDKDSLEQLVDLDYPIAKIKLSRFSDQLNCPGMKDSLSRIYAEFEALILIEKRTMNELPATEDDSNPVVKSAAQRLVENEVWPRTPKLTKGLVKVVGFEQKIRDGEAESMDHSSLLLSVLISLLAITVILLGTFLSIHLTKLITKPIGRIKTIIDDLGRGKINKLTDEGKGHEIGEMIRSVNNLSDKLAASAAFAHEVGERNFDTYYEPLSNSDLLGKALITMRDNLKIGEIQLLKANFEMATLFNNIEEAFFSVDMVSYQMIQMSPAAEKIYGYPVQDFINDPTFWYKIVLAEDKKIIDANNILMYAGHSFSQEYRIKSKNGSIRWVETQITPTMDEQSKLIRIDGVTTDITERKESEETLRTNNAELKKTNSELDKFVYSVSHDLRAPLCSMLGVVELSESLTEDEVIIDHLGMLKSSIKRLDGFIADILDYSRNARIEVRSEPIHFKNMLTGITENLKYMDSMKRLVDIRMHIDEQYSFASDKSRLWIIVNNLVSNSIRYQNPEAEKPFVQIDAVTDKNGATITIADNGIGIRKEFHDKVFDMFYRVSENSIGSGLGLYIVKETIDKLHGVIKLDSKPGEGSKFIIHIPHRSDSLTLAPAA